MIDVSLRKQAVGGTAKGRLSAVLGAAENSRALISDLADGIPVRNHQILFAT